MIYLIFFIVALTNSSVTTSLNCPAGFDIQSVNTTSVHNANFMTQIADIYSMYSSDTMIKIFRKSFMQGDQTQISKYKTTTMIPYVFLGTVFFIIYVILIISCVFEKCCPPCKSWKKKKQSKTYLKSQIRWTAIFTALLSISITLVCIAAFLSLINMKDSIDSAKCTFYLALDTALYGNKSGWMGFDTISTLVSDISQSLNSTVNSINTYIGPNNSWINNNINTLLNNNIDMYYKYQHILLSSPDPNTTNGINSMFISQGLGPITQNGTMTNAINNALQQLNIISKSAAAIDSSAHVIVDSYNMLMQNLNNSMIQMNMYSTNLHNSQSTLDYYSNNYIFLFQGSANSFLQAIICLLLFGSIVSFLGVIGTHIFDIHECRVLVHMAWVGFGVLYIGVLIFTYSFLSLGTVTYELCQYYQLILTDLPTFQQYSTSMPNNIIYNLGSCLYEDGNVLKTFGISGQMAQLRNLYKNITIFQSLIIPISQNFINLAHSFATISNWTAIMKNYRDGLYIDSNSSDLSDRNPNVALQSMNNYTLMQIYPSENCTSDHWVFNEANCSKNERVYSPGINYTNGMTMNISAFCLSLNSAINQSQLLQGAYWTEKDFSQRYSQIAQDCPNSFSVILNYGYSLINYRDSRINLYQSIIDDLDFLLEIDKNYIQQIANFYKLVGSFTNDTTTMAKYITDPFQGLPATDCSIVGDQLRLIYNSYCINYMVVATKICLCLMALCFITLMGVFSSYIFAMRYSKIERDEFEKKQLKLNSIDKKQDKLELEYIDSDIGSGQD